MRSQAVPRICRCVLSACRLVFQLTRSCVLLCNPPDPTSTSCTALHPQFVSQPYNSNAFKLTNNRSTPKSDPALASTACTLAPPCAASSALACALLLAYPVFTAGLNMHARCIIQRRCSQALLVLAGALCLISVQSAKLLVVPLAGSSHIAAFTALTTALEQHGGHEIYMVRLPGTQTRCSNGTSQNAPPAAWSGRMAGRNHPCCKQHSIGTLDMHITLPHCISLFAAAHYQVPHVSLPTSCPSTGCLTGVHTTCKDNGSSSQRLTLPLLRQLPPQVRTVPKGYGRHCTSQQHQGHGNRVQGPGSYDRHGHRRPATAAGEVV